MDVTRLLRPPAGYDPSNMTSLAEENERLRRLLSAMVRACNSTKQELESVREALGFNKSPLPFLQLPREVRDQIYLYALQASVNVQTEPRPIACLNTGSLQWKPPTPGLCLTNKQILREANEIMYSRNTFHFSSPGVFLRFEEQIGSWNRDLVQRIEILTTNFPEDTMMDPDLVAPCDYSAVPAHWVKAFNRSRLNSIVQITIAGEQNSTFPLDDDWALMDMPECLRKAIICVFERNKKDNLTPRLVLKGFEKSEREKFPANWTVTTSAGYFEPDKTLNYD